jgi:archaellum component FlaF (FlaF/FlaG flagellin family)
MGFSVVIASFIVLIGFVAVFSTVATVMFTSTQDLTFAANEYITKQQDKINTQMQLSVDSVGASQCQITIRNVGSKTIFFHNSNGYSTQWHSYTIETYNIQAIKITSTNTTINPATHNFVNPGEQASILVNLPGGAEPISSQDIVSVTFASYSGAAASSEGAMQ